MKQTARIDNWFVLGDRLCGTVTEHPRQGEFFEQGQITSPIVSIDEENNIAETKNTIYTLGQKLS